MNRGTSVAASLLVAAMIVCAVSGEGGQAQTDVVSRPVTALSPHGAFLNRHCVSCHNAKLKNPAGGLSLDRVDVDNVAENAAVWERALVKLRARSMPPPGPGRPRPDAAAYESIVSYLERSLDRAALQHPNPGRTETFHRLNRVEYRNAVRDLLALDIEVDSLLPTDNASHGFDNVNVAGLSPTLVEQYLSAARKISRLAVGTALRTPDARTVVVPLDRTQDYHVEGLPHGTRGGTMFTHNFPVDGEYAFQLRLSRNRDEQVEGFNQPLEIELMLDGARLQLFTLTPKRPARGEPPPDDQYGGDDTDVDAGLNGRFQVKAGPHTVAAAFLSKPGYPEAARQPFKADFNGRSLAAIFSVSVAGPYAAAGAGDTPSRQRIFTCRPGTPDATCARSVTATLARRAFRRAVTDADVNKLLAYYEQGRSERTSEEGAFEAGIEMVVRAILSSPDFLFRIERDPQNLESGAAYRISDVELASRLSFFLWSSIPDDELLDAAIRGRLRTPAVLERQVRRMLADKRSAALVDNFAEQWLYLRNLNASAPDPTLFPDFDDNLRQAFRRETRLFFESIKSEDRSVLDLLNADYTFVNERLAHHYGLPNVYGTHFRRVPLPVGGPRSGLLGHASILTVTSYANRTSPVQRGKWILENLLGMPPPPPPANVPPLKDDNKGKGGKVLSVRERMVEHRANPVCASCHSVMDPIGLSMENFDATGRWRTTDGDAAVDASGGFIDGSTFEGVDGLKKALMSRPDLFVSALSEKLLTYAVGRGLEHYDAPAVRAIVGTAAADNYRFSSIMLGIVRSVPFQMRKAES
jgi:Protein of unknown function (DUF1592)/Protein of unknown function (DUF1588)/Protein of unknown function (DUF1585)/Protein of unknown function (DUF1595)/Protein of unknown function (DUF1587)/Planctomycete cytochrome C